MLRSSLVAESCQGVGCVLSLSLSVFKCPCCTRGVPGISPRHIDVRDAPTTGHPMHPQTLLHGDPSWQLGEATTQHNRLYPLHYTTHCNHNTPTTGYVIEKYSALPDECELLLPPMARFEVSSPPMQTGTQSMIHLKQIAPTEDIMARLFESLTPSFQFNLTQFKPRSKHYNSVKLSHNFRFFFFFNTNTDTRFYRP